MKVEFTDTKAHVSNATILSIVLHAVVIALFWFQFALEQPKIQKAPPAKISLGIRTASAGEVAQNSVSPQQSVSRTEEHKVNKAEETSQPVEKTEPVEKAEPSPEPTPKEAPKVLPEIKKAPKPSNKVTNPTATVAPKVEDKAVQKPLPKQTEVEKPPVQETPTKVVEKPKTEVKQAPQPKQVSQVDGSQGINGSEKSKIQKQETGKSTQQSGDPNTAIFDAELRQHLMKFKQYPRSLKLKRKEGAVEVSFIINNQGELISHKILSRKGHRDFEKATEKLFNRAKPFPKPPSTAQWKQREYRLVFNYELN